MEGKTIKPVKYSFCLSSYVYNNLQTYKDKTLILDTREQSFFHRYHLPSSIHLCSQKIQHYLDVQPDISTVQDLKAGHLHELLGDAESALFSQRKRCFCVIIMRESSLPREFLSALKKVLSMDSYEDCWKIEESGLHNELQDDLLNIPEKDSLLLALEVFKMLQKERVSEVHILLDGMSKFLMRYPYLDISPSSSSATAMSALNTVCASPQGIHKLEDISNFPHDILDGRLFLGNFKQSEQYNLIKKLRITHILNVTMECNNIHEDKGVKYLKVPLLDESHKRIYDHFKEAFAFIEQALNENSHNSVLVHCALGKSRSATMVIMFLMKKFAWEFDRAYHYVKEKRQYISPNDGFIKQLQEFELNQFEFVEKAGL